jgi:DHA1 family multidrug resistance protein-like MFS transporter
MEPSSSKQALDSRWQRTLYIFFFAQMMTAVGFHNIIPFLPLYVKESGPSTKRGIEFSAGLVCWVNSYTGMFILPI